MTPTKVSAIITLSRTQTNDNTRWSDITMLAWINRFVQWLLSKRNDLRILADGTLLSDPPDALVLADPLPDPPVLESDWPLPEVFVVPCCWYVAYHYFMSDSENVRNEKRAADYAAMIRQELGLDVKG